MHSEFAVGDRYSIVVVLVKWKGREILRVLAAIVCYTKFSEIENCCVSAFTK